MLTKQVTHNLLEYFSPIIFIKPSLVALKHKFWKVRALFFDEAKLEYFSKLEDEVVNNKISPVDNQKKDSQELAEVWGLGEDKTPDHSSPEEKRLEFEIDAGRALTMI